MRRPLARRQPFRPHDVDVSVGGTPVLSCVNVRGVETMHEPHGPSRHRRSTVIAALVAFGILAASAQLASASAAKVTPPPAIAKAGAIHFCTDPTGGPPASYVNSSGAHLGSDMDIARRVAALMGVKAEIETISFGNIVPLLNSGSCDAYIGGISDTPERQKIERFADYGQFGEEFLVLKGNPKHITSYASLSGLTAGTTVGTVDQAFLEAENKKLSAAGKPKITIRAFSAANAAYQALLSGQVDVAVGGYTALAGAAKQLKAKVQFALPNQVNVLPTGIASRKSDPQLNAAFKRAIAAMYKDGSMRKILKKWEIEKTILAKAPKA
jgi:polar amino acid transport system substrate-binding protein